MGAPVSQTHKGNLFLPVRLNAVTAALLPAEQALGT
jgi:hypothetical protein